MSKRKLLYIPLLLLFAFAMATLVSHYLNVFTIEGRVSRLASLPFSYNNGRVELTTPAAEVAGIRVGDKMLAMDGRTLDSQIAFDEAYAKLDPDRPIVVSMSRAVESGDRVKFDATVTPIKVERDIEYYSQYIVGFIFSYILPTVSIFLGFWVVFIRPADPVAWILLFVLLGLASFGLEFYWDGSALIGIFQKIFFASWAISMLLFGIYFPERWILDEKFPWLKWFLIVPLSFQVVLAVLGLVRSAVGIDPFAYLGPVPGFYRTYGFFPNMLAIGLFFAALAYKLGTTKNPDAKRRLRIMLYGTSIAITPTFFLVLYRFVSGAQGSFFQIVPFWIGVSTLLLMLLFPLTMAYVIVVHRAMDVSIVVRQGLQYALAKNGVFVLQIGLSIAVIVAAFSFVSDSQTNRPQKIMFIAIGITLVFLIRWL